MFNCVVNVYKLLFENALIDNTDQDKFQIHKHDTLTNQVHSTINYVQI